MNRDRLAENFIKARDAAGLTQAAAAKECGIQTAVLSRIERGQGNPQLLTLVRYARGVGVSVEDLVRGTDRD